MDLNEKQDAGPLGKEVAYQDKYAPELLHPIPREHGRKQIGLDTQRLPFNGEDRWTAYELSWLDIKGKPLVAIGQFSVPASSANIIESKSLKLYLNSFNQSVFKNAEAVQDALEKDLSKAAGASVSVALFSLSTMDANPQLGQYDARLVGPHVLAELGWQCLDDIDAEAFEYQPNPALLALDSEGPVSEKLVSHLLRTNCPVTGQPDWASVFIAYSGKKINHASLLRYLVSYRQCQDFHEQCVERIYKDLLEQMGCDSLTVFARYTRRGGLDINPYRTSQIDEAVFEDLRLARQ